MPACNRSETIPVPGANETISAQRANEESVWAAGVGARLVSFAKRKRGKRSRVEGAHPGGRRGCGRRGSRPEGAQRRSVVQRKLTSRAAGRGRRVLKRSGRNVRPARRPSLGGTRSVAGAEAGRSGQVSAPWVGLLGAPFGIARTWLRGATKFAAMGLAVWGGRWSGGWATGRNPRGRWWCGR